MKRSEVVNKLKTYIAIWSNGQLTQKELTSEADGLIDIFLKMGFLPPAYPKAHDLPGIDNYHVFEPEENLHG